MTDQERKDEMMRDYWEMVEADLRAMGWIIDEEKDRAQEQAHQIPDDWCLCTAPTSGGGF